MSERYGPLPTSQGVRGYRNLEPHEVELINRIKLVEEDVARIWHNVAGMTDEHDPRWLAVARTHFQEGFTALVRSVAQPHDPFQGETEADAAPGRIRLT